MNCQQIQALLDESDIGALGEEPRRGIEAHLSSCPDCAGEWQAFDLLRATRIPAMPRELPAACSILVARKSVSYARRNGRLLLLGVALAVAAAAAMWVGRRPDVVPPPGVAASALPAATAAAEDGRGVVQPASLMAPGNVPAEQNKKSMQSVAAFTVRVLPVEDRTTDDAGREAVSVFHASLIQELHKVRGLVLLDGNSTEGTAVHPSYEIKIKAAGSARDNRWNVDLLVIAAAGGDRPVTPFMTSENSVLTPLCSGQAVERQGLDCSDPAGAAARMLELLRQVAFPIDPVWQGEMIAQLRDRRVNEMQRFKALSSLRAERPRWKAGVAGGAVQVAYVRPEAGIDVIQGAMDLATSARNPMIIAQIWRQMRGLRQPELIQPLIDATRPDVDPVVRVEAVTTLGTDFAATPIVQAALASVARNDESALVRMVARRAAEGDQVWQDYVVSALADKSLSDMQRVEPLVYLASQGQYTEMQKLLDSDSLGLLAQLLPRLLSRPPALADSSEAARSLTPLVSGLPAKQPALLNMYIEILGDSKDRQIRRFAVNALRQQSDDPRARKVLDEVAVNDDDPALRELARSLLAPR
jgi:hypothetical protein